MTVVGIELDRAISKLRVCYAIISLHVSTIRSDVIVGARHGWSFSAHGSVIARKQEGSVDLAW